MKERGGRLANLQALPQKPTVVGGYSKIGAKKDWESFPHYRRLGAPQSCVTLGAAGARRACHHHHIRITHRRPLQRALVHLVAGIACQVGSTCAEIARIAPNEVVTTCIITQLPVAAFTIKHFRSHDSASFCDFVAEQ